MILMLLLAYLLTLGSMSLLAMDGPCVCARQGSQRKAATDVTGLVTCVIRYAPATAPGTSIGAFGCAINSWLITSGEEGFEYCPYSLASPCNASNTYLSLRTDTYLRYRGHSFKMHRLTRVTFVERNRDSATSMVATGPHLTSLIVCLL